MAKAIVYLIGVAFSLLLLRATGLLDGMFDRGNLREREKFWQETVAKEAPEGTPKSALEVLVARHGMALDCFHSSLKPPIEECRADDPASKGGGMAAHPMACNCALPCVTKSWPSSRPDRMLSSRLDQESITIVGRFACVFQASR